jgi:hypothetical protein
MTFALLALLLTVTPRQGFVPLEVTVTASIGHTIEDGEVCLAHGDTDTEVGVSCWEVHSGDRQRSWVRKITLFSADEWHIILSVRGRDSQGRPVTQRAPVVLIDVRQNHHDHWWKR